MIQPVLVVPRLALISTPTDCEKGSTPALTKPIVMSVVALEDWMVAVTAMPEKNAVIGRRVNDNKALRRESPAKDLSPSLISVMPRRKSPTPPRMLESIVNMAGLFVDQCVNRGEQIHADECDDCDFQGPRAARLDQGEQGLDDFADQRQPAVQRGAAVG